MASKPFVLNTANPGDTDTVSQFPALDRGDKGIIQSWLLTDHNVDGTHTQASLVQVGTLLSDGTTTTVTPTPASGRTALFRDTDGGVKLIKGDDSSVEFVPVPPGTIVAYAGSASNTTAPVGWLLCYGQAISRSTYARLFTAIGTTYGVGDGSTTFNIPDLRGQVVAGKDDMGGTAKNFIGSVTTDNGVISGTTLGSFGGSAKHTQTVGELVTHTHLVSDNGHAHTYDASNNNNSASNPGSGRSMNSGVNAGGGTTSTATTGIAIQTQGSSAAMSLLQPTAILYYMIHI